MPVEYRLVPAQRLVQLKYTDPLTVKNWTAAILEVFADAAYEPGFNIIADRRGVALPTREFADAIVAFVRKHRQMFGTAKVAIVVNDIAAFGMARMQEGLNESAGLETRAFRSEAEAYAWLDVPV